MSYGLATISEFATTDVVAPGAPTFVLMEQIDNDTMRATVSIPTTDATGGPLTGLARLTVATATMSAGANPFDGLSMPEILAFAGAASVDVELTEADAGTQKEVILPIVNLGGFHALAAACNDE